MPVISTFYGIKIIIHWEDHLPPHFHAEYNGEVALIDIVNIRVIEGKLPSRPLKLVLAWGELHKDELLQNWHLA